MVVCENCVRTGAPGKDAELKLSQRVLSDIEAINKRRVAGRSGLLNHVKNYHALAGQILCFLDLMQFTSKYSKM